MTVKELINTILKHDFAFANVPDDAYEAINELIKIGRKYGQIKEVMNDYFHNDLTSKAQVIKEIERIIENGNDD